MEEPLPTLKYFNLGAIGDESVPVLPRTFLGGSVPLLELFILSGIALTFPKFVSSYSRIAYLHLFNIPHVGYVSSGLLERESRDAHKKCQVGPLLASPQQQLTHILRLLSVKKVS